MPFRKFNVHFLKCLRYSGDVSTFICETDGNWSGSISCAEDQSSAVTAAASAEQHCSARPTMVEITPNSIASCPETYPGALCDVATCFPPKIGYVSLTCRNDGIWTGELACELPRTYNGNHRIQISESFDC